MDWLYLFYALLATLLVYRAKVYGPKEWNEECFSHKQTKALLGFTALCIFLHHAGQKTAAPWHEWRYIVHGLDVFIPYGYFFVALFLFCSGFGLYKSLKSKKDYLRHFIRRRILPVVIAFYISEIIFTVVRLLMGQKMNFGQILIYLSGAQLANFNAWYAVAIPFFYLLFWFAFRFVKKDGLSLLIVWLGTLLYTLLGVFVDHNDWLMTGEWWYNSIWLFPMGLMFGRFEISLTKAAKKLWPLFTVLAILGTVAFTDLAVKATDSWWGYYGETWFDPLKIPHRLMCCGMQWIASFSFVCAVFLLMMKVKLGNPVLSFLGSMTLEFYLIHGLFLELFGYSFLDLVKPLNYIKNVPLYLCVTLPCSILAALILKGLLAPINKALRGNRDLSINK